MTNHCGARRAAPRREGRGMEMEMKMGEMSLERVCEWLNRVAYDVMDAALAELGMEPPR